MYDMPRYEDEVIADIAPMGTIERVEQLIEEYRGTVPGNELDTYRAVFEHTGARDALRYAMEHADATVIPSRYNAWGTLASVAEDVADALGE